MLDTDKWSTEMNGYSSNEIPAWIRLNKLIYYGWIACWEQICICNWRKKKHVMCMPDHRYVNVILSYKWTWHMSVGKPILSFIPSFSPSWHAVLSYWPYLEVMTGRTAFINGLLAEVFQGFLSCKVNARRSVHSPMYDLIITLCWQTWLTWPSGQVTIG